MAHLFGEIRIIDKTFSFINYCIFFLTLYISILPSSWNITMTLIGWFKSFILSSILKYAAHRRVIWIRISSQQRLWAEVANTHLSTEVSPHFSLMLLKILSCWSFDSSKSETHTPITLFNFLSVNIIVYYIRIIYFRSNETGVFNWQIYISLLQ